MAPTLLAALSPTSFGYRLILLLHLLAVIVGFGSTFVYPVMAGLARKNPGPAAAAISDAMVRTGKMLTSPVILLSGLTGLLLILAGPHDFDEIWLQASITIFLLAFVFQVFVAGPNQGRMNDLAQELAAAGPPPSGGGGGTAGPPPQVTELEARGKAAARNGGFLHLMFVVILVLMVWKPN